MEQQVFISFAKDELEALIHNSVKSALIQHAENNGEPQEDRWFTIEELCEYLPGNPVKATIYGKVHNREIPHKKFGKRLAFLKSEVDEWLKAKSRKTTDEVEREAGEYLAKRKRR